MFKWVPSYCKFHQIEEILLCQNWQSGYFEGRKHTHYLKAVAGVFYGEMRKPSSNI